MLLVSSLVILFPLKFVAISDTHCLHRNIKLPKGDVLLHAGDISYKGKKSEVVDFLGWFSKTDFKYKVFIAGNHDFYFEKEGVKEIQSTVPENVIYLMNSEIVINGIKIWGSPYTPWFFDWAFNERRGAAITKHWKLIPDDVDILLTHGPVQGILDTVVSEEHVGCKNLLQRVLEVKPKTHVCGHIHESYGSVKRSGIHFINASLLNEAYELMNKPIVFDLK
ncbi:MAG TPA: metallophosphatase domain-containing protein [Chitinophagaceae bacterium]|nr:metallophosphatase domain-containing protein [Chitinophagaceae bacterium]